MSGLHFEITGGNEGLVRKLAESRRAILDSSKTAEEQGAKIEGMFKRMASGAAIFGAGFSASQFVKDVINVRGEFQQLDVAFTTLLQSKEKANALMAQMVQTAAKTPYNLTDLATGAKQLVAYGFASEGINDSLIRLGNIASGLGLPLERLTYLYGTTMTQGRLYTRDLMQFTTSGIPMLQGLADMFGVSTDKVNEMVTAGRVGFPEVQKVIENLTNEGGKFFNLMEEQSKTLTGKISNLGDAWDTMLNKIGQSQEGVINDSIDGLKYLVENYETVGKTLLELAATYGAYKAILITITALQKAHSAVVAQAVVEQSLCAFAGHKLSDAQAIAVARTKLLTIAQQGLMKSLKATGAALAANPYILVAAAVAGLSLAIYKVATAETELEKAQERLSDAEKESEKAALSEQRELAKLKGELAATTKGTEEYNRIKDQIVSKYGKYDKNLKDEIDKVGLLDTTYQNLTKSIQQSFDVRQYEKFKQEQDTALNDVMSDNLDNMYDKLVSKWGDELGAKYYTEIKNALMAGEEIPQHLNNVVSNMYGVWAQSLHGYINNIREAQKATEEANKKALVKFSINDGGKDDGKKGENKKLSSVSEEIKTITANIATLKQQLTDLRSGKTSAEAGKTIQSVIEDKAKELKTAEDALATLTGTTKKEGISANTLQSEQSDRLRAIEDYRKSISEAEVQAELDIRQQGIEAMDEGSKKELAMIHLNYDRLRDANRKRANEMIKERQELERKQWEYDNPKWKEKGMTFKPTTTGVQQLSPSQQRQLLDYDNHANISRQKATKDHLDKERQAMDEYLKEYGSYMEKKQAITDLYNEKIAKASTGGEKLSLKKQLNDELKTLDLSEFKKGINFAEVFGNLDSLTTDSVTRLRDKLKEYINKAASGLRPEDLKELSDALSNIEIKAAEKNPFGEIGKSLEDYGKTSKGVEDAQERLNYVMAGGEIATGLYEDATGKLCKKLLTQEQAENNLVTAQDERAESLERMNTSLAAGVGKAQEYLGVATAMVGALEAFGVEVPEQLTGFIDGIGTTLDSLASIDLTKPMSIITGAIGAIGGLGKAIGSLFNNDRGKEKNIQRLQDQIEVLDKSYDKLGRSIEKAYSKDASKLIGQQNEMLEQQKVLIQRQIAEEEAKKNTDDEKIQAYRDQMDEITDTIADNKEKAQDAIFGTDIKSAIDNFAQAYVDAWAAGENRSKSMKDVVKNMIKGVVVEMMKSNLAPTIQLLRDKIEKALSDGIISDYEQGELDRLIEQTTSNLDSKYSWADKYLKGEDEPKEGVSGQLNAAMTEGTASQLVGLWNSTAIDMRELKNLAADQRDSARSIMGDVIEILKQSFLIEQHTRRGADNTDGLIEELRIGFSDVSKRLGSIEKNTKTSNSRG